MINSSPAFSIPVREQQRNSLWFSTYHYCLLFFVSEASCLRRLDHISIDNTLAVRREWGRKFVRNNYGGNWHASWQPLNITETTKENLHRMCDWLLCQNDYKMTINGDWIYFYTNDPAHVHDILGMPGIDPNHAVLKQAQIIGQPNTVYLRDPKHQYRSYFRHVVLTSQQSQTLKNLLAQQTEIKISPSLKSYIGCGQSKNTRDYYFFDHDSQGMLSMLALVNPRLIRKTLNISMYK